MKTAAMKTMGRRDVPQYDLTAVFEALVNAVAHRDYAIYGSKIRLKMFADRLELYSPGGLANTMTVESLALRQSVRNEVVTSLLARCAVPEEWRERLPLLETGRTAMMDRRGEGVPVILERSLALSGRVPEYRLLDGEELVLVVYAAGPVD
jgi:predicted HTH transcriptional regulator